MGNRVIMAESKEDFLTHLNYVKCLRKIADGLNITPNLRVTQRFQANKLLAKKRTLVKLIKKSLDAEFKEICQNRDFSEVCVPWIAVKSYYLLFNVCLIIGYLMEADDSYFNSSHEKILNDMKIRIRNKTIAFNRRTLNKVYCAWDVFKWRFPRGYNIRLSRISLEDRYRQLLKKLVMYKIEDFQRRKRIKNWKAKTAQEKRDKELRSSDMNICDFFYWYRIKANYRDLEFLDKNITCQQFYDFYDNYYRLTMNFYGAFKNLINDLAKNALKVETYIDF